MVGETQSYAMKAQSLIHSTKFNSFRIPEAPSAVDTAATPQTLENPRFACPYFKRNPAYHIRCGPCFTLGFQTVNRLIYHLYRLHKYLSTCPRCHEVFSGGDTELDNHLASVEKCEEKTSSMPPCGITEDQERALRKLARALKPEEEKWKVVYLILFPEDEEVPSPYLNLVDTDIIVRYDNLYKFDLRRIVQKKLEDICQNEPTIISERMRGRILEIVRTSQDELLQSMKDAMPADNSEVPMPASSKQKQEHDRFKHLKNHVPWPASVAIGHKSTTTNSGALRIVILPSDLTNDSGYGTILENGFDEVAKPYFGEVNSPRGSETYLENSVIENLANKVEPVVKAGLSEESSQKEETRSQCEPVSPALEAEGTSTDSSSEYWGDENMLDDERWAYIESETGRSSQLVRDRTVDYLMLKAYELGPNISNKTNGPEDGVEAKCRGSKASPDSFPGTTSTQGHKRALRQDESNDFDNEGRRKRLKPEDSVDIRLSGKSDRLACPFFQRTPLRYQNEVCTGPGFNNIKQLKDHFRRRHRLPLHCSRCWITFQLDADLDAHDNSLEACERHPEHALEGVNDRQWIRLHNNTMFTSAQNNEDKWRGIYRMLFPHDLRVPSPYYQYYTVATDGPSSSLPLNFGSDYAIFFSVEHPRLLRQRLRQILESTPDVVVPGFEEELTIIYQECAEQVLRDFSNRHRDFNAPSESLNDIPTRSLQDGSDDHLPPVSTQQVPENTASNQTAGEDVPNSSGQTIQTLESLSTIQILADETTSTRTTVTSTESLENDDEEGRRCQILGVNGRPGGDGSPFAVDWGKTGDKVGLEWLTDMPVNDHLSDVPDTEIVSARPTLANPGNTEFLDFEFSPSDLGFFGESFELPHLSTLDESATSRKDND